MPSSEERTVAGSPSVMESFAVLPERGLLHVSPDPGDAGPEEGGQRIVRSGA